MRWLKLTHNSGSDYINLEQVYRILPTSTASIIIYDSNSILPIVYVFADADTRDTVLLKFEKIVSIIDIDQLATQ